MFGFRRSCAPAGLRRHFLQSTHARFAVVLLVPTLPCLPAPYFTVTTLFSNSTPAHCLLRLTAHSCALRIQWIKIDKNHSFTHFIRRSEDGARFRVTLRPQETAKIPGLAQDVGIIDTPHCTADTTADRRGQAKYKTGDCLCEKDSICTAKRQKSKDGFFHDFTSHKATLC